MLGSQRSGVGDWEEGKAHQMRAIDLLPLRGTGSHEGPLRRPVEYTVLSLPTFYH